MNGNQLFDLSDITLNVSFQEKSYYSLNSIFKRAIRRAHFEASVKFTTNSNVTQLQSIFYSASSPSGSDTIYTVKDGQQGVATALLTVYTDDTATRGFQYVLENPTVLDMSQNVKMEDYASTSITIACTKLTSVQFTP
jgi:hypothetical protein